MDVKSSSTVPRYVQELNRIAFSQSPFMCLPPVTPQEDAIRIDLWRIPVYHCIFPRMDVIGVLLDTLHQLIISIFAWSTRFCLGETTIIAFLAQDSVSSSS